MPNDEEPTHCGFLKLTKNELIALGIAMAVMMFLRLPLYTPLKTNLEDYFQYMFVANNPDIPIQGIQGIANASCQTGRFTYYFLNWCLDQIDVSPYSGYIVNLPLGTLGVLITGLLIVRLWGIDFSVSVMTILMLIIALHPFAQEMFHYRVALTYWGVFPLTVLPYLTVRRNFRSILFGSLCLAVSIGAYQTFFNVSIAVFLFYLFIEGIRELRCYSRPSFFRLWQCCRVSECLTVTFLGCILCGVINKIFLWIVPWNGIHYSNLVTFRQLPLHCTMMFERFVGLYSFINPKFNPPLPIIPMAAALLVLFGLAALIFCGYRGRVREQRVIFGLFLIGLFLMASYIAPLGTFSLISPVTFPAFPPRIPMFISVFWGGVFVAAWLLFQDRVYWRRSIIIAFSVLLLAYAYFLSSFIVSAYQITKYDHALAVRIIADLEKLPDCNKIKKICVLPFSPILPYPASFAVVQNGYFCPIFQCPVTKVCILNEVSGQNFINLAYLESFYETRCPNLPIWPAPGSIVIIDGDTAVIRLQ